ncbi:MAG: dicarboxylate/amino acid:cation symporter [Planctomycetaceae bacterium]
MDHTTPPNAGWIARWRGWPLYGRILGALLIGVLLGVLLGEKAGVFELPAKIILQLLGALAPPLILIAVTHVLMTTEISGSTTLRLGGLLILNTVVAICVGLFVANLVKPGNWAKMKPPEQKKKDETKALSPTQIFIDNIPKSLIGPLGDKPNVIGVIVIACAFGVALRAQKSRAIANVQDIVEVAYQALVSVLHWIIDLVPIGVLSIVAKVVGTEGFGPFKAMAAFIVAVLLALAIQACWYLLRIRFFSWCRPRDVLRGMRDSLLMAFSTGSSTATMPVTYACLKDKVGVRERSASLGALVGANFNNDGTALYEAMSALFVAQLLGIHLGLGDQLLVVLTSIVASVGAAGIPEAGLVTMTLVFTAVKLPTDYIALLLTVDWFLDRSRTTINVLGDVNVACLLDGRVKQEVPTLTEAGTGTAAPT